MLTPDISTDGSIQKATDKGGIPVNIPENILNTVTDEQKKKIEAAQSPEELLALAKESGYELSQEQLQAVSGGWCSKHCPGICQHGSCNIECTDGPCYELCFDYKS